MRAPLLIAEDSENDIVLFKMALAKSACVRSTYFVRDGEEAIEWLQTNGAQYALPLILITDLKMPRMDGFELLKWVRSEEKFSKIPVIAYSSSGMAADVNKAYELGATNYFRKTASFSDLVSFIETVV